MISRIGARAYRCFSHLDVIVPRHAVLAGANGMGKSTLLDIPVLIGDIVNGGLQQALLAPRVKEEHGPRAQTYRDILHRRHGSQCSLVLEAELPAPIRQQLLDTAPAKVKANPPTHLHYELRLQLRSETELRVEAEHLDLFPAGLRAPDLSRPPATSGTGWRSVIAREGSSAPMVQAEFRRGHMPPAMLAPDWLALSHVADPLLFPASSWFLGLLKEAVLFAPDYGKLRQAQPPGPLVGFSADAANLPWQILRLQQQDPERLAEWVHIVRLALPSVLDVRAVELEEDHHAYLRLTYRYGDSVGEDHAVTSSGLSDGTLRILAFTLLPYLDRLPPFLAVEQPEDGIHPRAIDIVLESLSELPDTQTF